MRLKKLFGKISPTPIRKRKASIQKKESIHRKSNVPKKSPPILVPPSTPRISDPIQLANNDSVDTNDPISTSFSESTTSQSWTSLKKEILDEYEATACITSPISTAEVKPLPYPSPHKLNSSGFRKPSLNHWFSVEGCLKTQSSS